jgi:hypothetical protein
MPGDSGIFATCNKGREARCVGELRDLFSEYASQLYGDAADDDDDNDNDGGATSIENDIKAELAGIQKPVTAQLFVPVKLDVQCGEFLKKKEEMKMRRRFSLGVVSFLPPSYPQFSLQHSPIQASLDPKTRLTFSSPQWSSSKQSPQLSRSASSTRSARTQWLSPCASARERPRDWRP